jgi:hypothetical protein
VQDVRLDVRCVSFSFALSFIVLPKTRSIAEGAELLCDFLSIPPL